METCEIVWGRVETGWKCVKVFGDVWRRGGDAWGRGGDAWRRGRDALRWDGDALRWDGDAWRWGGDVWRQGGDMWNRVEMYGDGVEMCGDVQNRVETGWRYVETRGDGVGVVSSSGFQGGESHRLFSSLCCPNPPSQHSFGQVSSGKWHEISALLLRSKSALIPRAEETKASEPRALTGVQGLSATRALLNDLLSSDTNTH